MVGNVIQWNLGLETSDIEHSLDLEHYVLVTKSGFTIYIYLDLVHSLDIETSTTATKSGF